MTGLAERYFGSGENMLDGQKGVALIRAERRLSMIEIQVVDIDLYSPHDNLLYDADSYRLDYCLSPRRPGTRIRFAERWESDRYEMAGDLFLVPPKEATHLLSCAGQRKVLICRLLTEPLQEVLDTHLEWTDTRLRASLDVASLSIKTLLARLAQEVSQPGFASDCLTEGLALQLAVELQRYYPDVADPTTPGGLAPWRLRIIDERLSDESAPPTVIELAALCKMSVRHLSRGFRRSREKSLGQYIAEHRLENGKKRLASGESIKSIAYSMGFSSPSSFCYAFRQAVGVTPAKFQAQIRVH